MEKSERYKARRLKRKLENDFYEKDARFWLKNKQSSSAERGEPRRPINSFAKRQLSGYNRGGGGYYGGGVTVYVVKFTLFADETISFLKIGISKNSIETRFEADAERYRVSIVHLARAVSRKNARILERSLHDLFSAESFRPPLPLLSGGNTECFSFNEKLQSEMRDTIESFNAGVVQLAERGSRKADVGRSIRPSSTMPV